MRCEAHPVCSYRTYEHTGWYTRRSPARRLGGCRPEKVWLMSGLRRVLGKAEEGSDAGHR